MAQDKYYGEGVNLSDPSNEGYAVVPHATQPLPNGVPKYIYVGTAGNLVVQLGDNKDTDPKLTFKVDRGYHAIRPIRVLDTSTAADIIALY